MNMLNEFDGRIPIISSEVNVSSNLATRTGDVVTAEFAI